MPDTTTGLVHHFCQAQKALNKAQNNNYSDKQKQVYQNSLVSLLEEISIQLRTYDKSTPPQIEDLKNELDFIFKSLEFLDSSILNLIPYEIVTCLDKALSDWNPTNQKYIIVTSLINNITGFSFDPTLAQNEHLYNRIYIKYSIKFEGRLVQINIPKTLAKDYLISGVHYHELGHFVDSKFSITHSITNQLLEDIYFDRINAETLSALTQFLPAIKGLLPKVDSRSRFLQCAYHIGEYFCDLFASQYVGDSFFSYLSYISLGHGTSMTHPEPSNRYKMVSNFLNKESNAVIQLINQALDAILEKQLEVKFEEVDTTDFYSFLPPVIANDKQLHGIFVAGNNVWARNWDLFRSEMKMTELPEPEQVYAIINNLIEKSIGNYIVSKKWSQVQTV